MINIILADDHNVVRNGIKLLLAADPDIMVTGEADSGLGVLEHLKNNTKADIILTDLSMPVMSGLELLREVTINYPGVPVVLLTMIDDQCTTATAFKLGARGYLLKDVGADELIFSLNHVFNGGKYMSAQLSQLYFMRSLEETNTPKPRTSLIEFSAREIEVLTLISDGFTNKEMADKLFLSQRTIEGHRQSLIGKTKTRNSASLIKYAVSNGIVS